MRRPLALALALALLGLAGRTAVAEDQSALAQKLREQVEKILRLMRENEKALLEASAGTAAEPRRPEVDLPLPPPTPPPGGEEGAGAGTPGGEGGKPGPEEIQRRLRELVEAQRQGARKIPGEMEELVRMIPPSGGGSGGSQDQPPQGSPPRPEDQQARDARKRLEEEERMRREEEERRKAEGREPDQPRDPNDPTRRDPDAEPGAAPTGRNVPAWMTGLPPEVRDAFANGDFGSVPAPYRDLVRRYVQWLNRQPAAGAGR